MSRVDSTTTSGSTNSGPLTLVSTLANTDKFKKKKKMGKEPRKECKVRKVKKKKKGNQY